MRSRICHQPSRAPLLIELQPDSAISAISNRRRNPQSETSTRGYRGHFRRTDTWSQHRQSLPTPSPYRTSNVKKEHYFKSHSAVGGNWVEHGAGTAYEYAEDMLRDVEDAPPMSFANGPTIHRTTAAKPTKLREEL